MLASQDVSGIEAFWGRPAIFEQFVLRIALPRARRVLDKTNDAPLELPRWHAVVNHESGVKHGNLVVRVPNASAPGLMREEVQHRLPADWYDGFAEPRTFDGSRAPAADELLERHRRRQPVRPRRPEDRPGREPRGRRAARCARPQRRRARRAAGPRRPRARHRRRRAARGLRAEVRRGRAGGAGRRGGRRRAAAARPARRPRRPRGRARPRSRPRSRSSGRRSPSA